MVSCSFLGADAEDSALKEVLNSLNCLDLYHVLLEENVNAHDVMKLSPEELEDIGVASENAARFFQEVERKKKGQEEKDALKNYLRAMDSIEFYAVLYKNGILAHTLVTLNNDTLKRMGVTLGNRRRLLDKIQSYLSGK